MCVCVLGMSVPWQCSESCHSLVLQTGLSFFSLLLFSLSEELVFTGALSLEELISVGGVEELY